MFIVYIHIHCIVCMYAYSMYVRTYTKTSTISLHIITITFSTYIRRHLTHTHTQHWGAPHTPDDGLDDKVLDGLPNGISVQVQLCPHVLPKRKKSPVWRGGGGRGGVGEGREWGRGECKGTRTNIRIHMYIRMYIHTYAVAHAFTHAYKWTHSTSADKL